MDKDYAKYNFNEKIYTKGRLVHAVIGKYVEEHKKTTYDELKSVFTDELQAKTAIQFSEIQVVFENINKIKKNEHKRFFMHTNELIKLADSAIVVSREWNKENIINFIHKAKLLGFTVLEITA